MKSINEIIGCHKRTGCEGSLCNCGKDHTITQELLKKEAIMDIMEMLAIVEYLKCKHGIRDEELI
jgi:hypothetical protein